MSNKPENLHDPEADKAAEAQETAEISETAEAPEAVESAGAAEAPEAAETAGAAEAPEAAETAGAAEAPEAAETAGAAEADGTIPDDVLITDYLAMRKAEAGNSKKNRLKLPAWAVRARDALRTDKKLRTFLICALVIAALVCLVVFGGQTLLDRAMRIVRYSGDTTRFDYDSHSSNNYLSFHDGLAVASVSGLLCLDRNGDELALIQSRNDPPALLQNGTVALSYGVGGNTLTAAHRKKGAILDRTIPGTLIDADLSADSCICYSSVQSGYKTVLTALNSSGEEIYSWYSSTQFFSQCAISKKAACMAAISLGLDGGSFQSSCVIFATDREEPIATVPLGSDLIYDLRFVSDRRLCAVGETALHYFDIDGSGCTDYSYDGSELTNYDLQADEFTAIVRNVNEAGSRYRITTVDSRGEKLAELALDAEIIDISANGRYLAVLTADALQVYDRRLRVCLSEENIGFATRVCVQEDGAAILIDGVSAYRVS